MPPVRFTTYFHRESGQDYRFIGYAELENDKGDRSDVCLFAPVVSGFDAAAQKKSDEHTVYLICEPKDFEALFGEGHASGTNPSPAERKAAKKGKA